MVCAYFHDGSWFYISRKTSWLRGKLPMSLPIDDGRKDQGGPVRERSIDLNAIIFVTRNSYPSIHIVEKQKVKKEKTDRRQIDNTIRSCIDRDPIEK